MMHMTLYWGIRVTLLFDSWKTNSWSSYLLSLIACFLFSVFYQFMEDRRLRFKSLTTTTSSSSSSSSRSSYVDATPLIGSVKRRRIYSPAKVATSVLFGINSAIGYLLMLAIMSFNGGVFLAVVFGLSVGYFLFRCGDDDDVDQVALVDNSCACG